MTSIDPAVANVIAAKQSAMQSQIEIALTEKALSATKHQGDAIVQLIRDAGNLGKAFGRGELFDATA